MTRHNFRRRPLRRGEHAQAARLANGIYHQLAELGELIGGTKGPAYHRSLLQLQERIYYRLLEPLIDEWENAA